MIHNFSAGPSKLPAAVLQQARDELLNWGGTGCSVMELSHRGPEFGALAERSEQRLRRLLAVPDNYAVLFLQGGATAQFALAPMNLGTDSPAAYVLTGHWSQKAFQAATEARITGPTAVVAARYQRGGGQPLPRESTWQIPPDAAYLHFTSNETIDGLQYHHDPVVGCPLLADMSSDFLSRPVNIANYGMIYAGAQKNAGPAGLTFVIIRDDLLQRCPADLPGIQHYRVLAEKRSMLNTPPVFSWYLADRVLQWIEERGGLAAMAEHNQRQAARLYQAIDASDYYSNEIHPESRSRMNVVFRLQDRAKEPDFVSAAEKQGLIGLKGHRAVGGIRASIYNAMTDSSIQALVEFMADFERQYG